MSWSPQEFEERLRRVGHERYHHRHPFNVRMHEGSLDPDEIRTWVRNRYYYQTRIPLKDAVVLAKAEDPDFRREWVQRIRDHDGAAPGEGGLQLWLRLAEAVGLDPSEVESLRDVLLGVREACDDYLRLVESQDLLGCVAASLTELFAGDLMKERIVAFQKHYPWIRAEGLDYFQSRTEIAPRDAAFALRYVLEKARTTEEQLRCIGALERKCEILWRVLDVVDAAFRRPRLSPHAELRFDEREGCRVLVLPERLIKVNTTGGEILSLCDGSRSIEAMLSELQRRHPRVRELPSDVRRFLEHLERLGALESSR